MQDDQRCPIWGTGANIKIESSQIREWESPRTGGKYKLDPPIFRRLEGTPLESAPPSTPLEENEKVKLTDWLIAERKKGVESPIVTDKVIEYIKTQPEKPMSERIKDFMAHLVGAYPLGFAVVIIPLPYQETSPSQNYEMLAHSSSLTFESLKAIAIYCANKGYLVREDTGWKIFSITIEGMIFVEDAVKEDKQSHQCFVAMWFDTSMTNIYQNAIAPAIEDAGYTPYRVDEDNHNNMIDNQIIAQIRQSHFIIADFTSEIDKPRGGVYYEAGFAHGLGKEVIWTCRADVIDHIHFDTCQYNHIIWNENDLKALYDGIYNSIGANIGYGEKKQNIYTSFQEDNSASS